MNFKAFIAAVLWIIGAWLNISFFFTNDNDTRLPHSVLEKLEQNAFEDLNDDQFSDQNDDQYYPAAFSQEQIEFVIEEQRRAMVIPEYQGFEAKNN